MDPERALEDLAARQHALAARWQLPALGYDRWRLRRAVAAGGWVLITPRVLRRTGSPWTPEQRLLAAVLDSGPGAVASHRSAAWLWGLPRFEFHPDDVIRPGRPRPRPGTGSVHLPRLWLPGEQVELRSIPCVSLPLTLIHLAGVLPPKRVERLLDSVVAKSPAVLDRLHQLLPLVAARGRPGIAVVRGLLDERPPGTRPPESGNERRFETLLDEANEPPLHRQVDVGGLSYVGRTDYLDPELLLIVEVQSGAFHTSLSDVRADERRVAALLAAGYRGVLFIWDEMLWDRPSEVAPAVREARNRLRADPTATFCQPFRCGIRNKTDARTKRAG